MKKSVVFKSIFYVMIATILNVHLSTLAYGMEADNSDNLDYFRAGILIYRPKPPSDEGIIRIPFATLQNPLEGTFDLSQCGDAGNYLRIRTGYRKEKKLKDDKTLNVWITHRSSIEQEVIAPTKSVGYATNELEWRARGRRNILARWSPEFTVGFFWEPYDWHNLTCRELLTDPLATMGESNLYEKCMSSPHDAGPFGCVSRHPPHIDHTKNFSVEFPDKKVPTLWQRISSIFTL